MTWSYREYSYCEFNELLGKVITKIEGIEGEDELRFKCDDGMEYIMYHEQDCCEDVYIEDIAGEIKNLIGYPILMADEISNSEDDPKDPDDDKWGTYTWTYYKLATIKGYVTIRWYGTSNGYYSESVSFVKKNIKGE